MNLYRRLERDEPGQTLFEEFWTEQFSKYKNIEEYGAKLKGYQDQLAPTDQRLTENNLIFQLVKGFPMHYDDIVTTIRVSKITFHQALLMLIEPERVLQERRQSKALIAKASTPTTHDNHNNHNNQRVNYRDQGVRNFNRFHGRDSRGRDSRRGGFGRHEWRNRPYHGGNDYS